MILFLEMGNMVFRKGRLLWEWSLESLVVSLERKDLLEGWCFVLWMMLEKT